MSQNSIGWKESTLWTKIGTVCVGVAGLVGLIIGLVIAEELADALESMAGGMLDINFHIIYIVEVILIYSIDFIVTFFLIKMHRWARQLGIYWGILAVLQIIPMFQGGINVMIITYIVQIIGAVCLLLAKSDFPKKQKN